MMTLFNRIGILATFLVLPSIAAADDGGWYLAADLGKTHYSDHAKFDSALLRITSPTSPVTFDDDGSGHRIAIGRRFSPYWGFEAGYVDLGEATAHMSGISFTTGLTCGLPCESSYDIDPKLKARGWTAELTGRLPLGADWALDGRAGFMRWRLDLDTDVTPTMSPPYGNTSVPGGKSFNGHGTKATYGFDVSWSFAEHWAARLGWDKYKSMSYAVAAFVTGSPVDVNMRSLGIEYRF